MVLKTFPSRSRDRVRSCWSLRASTSPVLCRHFAAHREHTSSFLF